MIKKPTYEELEQKIKAFEILASETKQVQEALRESEEKFRVLADSTPTAVLLYQDDRWIYANRAAEAISGYAADELIGMPFWSFVHSDYRAAIQKEGRKRQTGEKTINRHEFKIVAKDGTIKWVDLAGASTMIGGRLAGIVSVIDITKLKQKEEALSAEHQRLAAILDGSPVSAFVIDCERCVIAWNRVNETYSGIAAVDVLGKPLDLRPLFKGRTPPILAERLLDLTDEEILDRFAAKGVQKKKNFPETFATEASIWIGGKERFLNIQATRLRDAAGNVIGAIQCAEDITDQKEAAEALLESEALYRTALENSNDGVLILQEGRHVYCNQRFLDTLGRRSGEVIGQPLGDYIHPDDRATVQQHNDRHDRGLPNPQRLEVRVLRPDGAVIHVEISPVEVIYQGIRSILVYVRNISDRRRAEDERIRLHTLESVGTLAGGIAHDFNNLLTGIQGCIDLARMETPPGSTVQGRLMTAAACIAQAAELTRRLITFSTGGDPLKKISDLGRLVKEVAMETVGASLIEMAFYLDQDLWPAEVDAGQMRQVVRNLVTNAVEAMPEGGWLVIRAENVPVDPKDGLPLRKGAYIRLSVEDTGTGIPQHDLPLIFDPYFSTKERGSVKGMGLGLSVCHAIVGKHQGLVAVESWKGKGSIFRVYLPAAAESALTDN